MSTGHTPPLAFWLYQKDEMRHVETACFVGVYAPLRLFCLIASSCYK